MPRTSAARRPGHRAADGGHTDVAELLLARGAAVNARDNNGEKPSQKIPTPASHFLDLHALLEQTEKGLLTLGGCSIHDAAGKGDLEKVKTLLRDSPRLVSCKNIYGQRMDGMTPLHHAAAADQKEMAELLLANDADPNAKDSYGQTPLHWAARVGGTGTTESLLASKAAVNARTDGGKTPLHEAAEAGQGAVVKLLLAKNADANAKDILGRTPFDFAVGKGREDVAELLRQSGGPGRS
jgi:ankyrin repeat protein